LFLLSGAYAGPRELKVTGLSVVDEGGTPMARLGVEEVVFGDGTRQRAIGLFLHPSSTSSSTTMVYDGVGGPGRSGPDDGVYIQHPWVRMPFFRDSVRSAIDLGLAAAPEQMLVPVPSSLMAPLPEGPPRSREEAREVKP
jgi:hypothetical protein